MPDHTQVVNTPRPSARPAATDHSVDLDLVVMSFVSSRLTPDELGKFMRYLARAAKSRRPSHLQKMVLKIVAPLDGGDDVDA